MFEYKYMKYILIKKNIGIIGTLTKAGKQDIKMILIKI